MPGKEVTAGRSDYFDLKGKRLLIFIVAYNAETTLTKGSEPDSVEFVV
jgi:hypothetical protein